MILLQQMIIMFFYMMIGYWAKKKGFFGEEAGATISWIVVNIANPAMIISSVINGESSIEGKELVNTAVLAGISFAILIILAEILPRLFHTNGKERSAYKIMTVFNNIGFMGFPVISAAYGQEALLYAAIFFLPYNIPGTIPFLLNFLALFVAMINFIFYHSKHLLFVFSKKSLCKIFCTKWL